MPNTASAEEAILRTLLYADVFDYPLSSDEIHHFLIGLPLSREAVRAVVDDSAWLAERVTRVNGYFAARGRDRVADLRAERREASEVLWRRARWWGRVMAGLPFVRLVAVTGALAMDNATPGDDVDFLIVTTPGRVWLGRAACILVVRLARLFGVGLCPNYVLAETALRESRQDLFVAHELAQMTPVAGHELYRRMRAANDWAQVYLPNARSPLRLEPDLAPTGAALRRQRFVERALSGKLGDRLEAWERRRKIARFAPAAQRPGNSAILDAERVKGHFDDYGGPALRRYRERLAEFGVGPDEDFPAVRGH